MIDYRLTPKQLDELRAAHREATDIRCAYRIHTVILLGQGWSVAQVADALLIDSETVRRYFKRYRKGGLEGLLRMSYVGGEALLNEQQLAELDEHLQTKVYLSAKAVAEWVKERWGVCYTESGMVALLRRLGYRYKKPKIIPGKADPEAQRNFLATEYKKAKEKQRGRRAVLFYRWRTSATQSNRRIRLDQTWQGIPIEEQHRTAPLEHQRCHRHYEHVR